MTPSGLPYSYASTPIMETWLMKALRLAHSKKPADQERLRKFYREVCENESMASRITMADALREPRDTALTVDPVERDFAPASSSTVGLTSPSVSAPNVVRMRPAPLTTDPSLGGSSESGTNTGSTAAAFASPLSGTSALLAPSQHCSISSSVTTGIVDSNVARINKRTKVSFFNIFDATSPSSASAAKGSSALTTSTVRACPPTGTPTAVLSSGCPPSPSSTAINLSTIPTVPLTVSTVTTSTIDLTVESDTGSEPIDSTASASYSELTPPPIAVSTRKISGTGSADLIEAVAPSVDTASDPLKATTSTSNTPTADAQLLAILVAELACCVCGKLTRQPQLEPDGKTMNANIMVECVQCGALYHPMCHQPPVLTSSSTSQRDWRCSSCVPPVTESGNESVEVQLTDTTTIPTNTEMSMPKSPVCTVASSHSPSLVDPGPTVGARKRKAGLQSALSGSAFRRL